MKFGPACPGANISVSMLDQMVWSRVESIVLNPELVAREVDRIKARDPISEDLASLDATIAGRETEHRRLLGNLKAFEPGTRTAEAVIKQLQALEIELGDLRDKREKLKVQKREWELEQTQIDDLSGWCRTVAQNLANLTYEQKRDALYALGIEVRIWKTGRQPRWELRANVDLDLFLDSRPAIVSSST
jgi:hypothetical protein